MRHFRLLIPLITLIFITASCSDDEEETTSGSFDSGIPATKTIVSNSTPSGITASLTTSSFEPMSTSCTLNASSSASDILDCFQRRLFAEPADNDEAQQLPDTNIFKHVSEFDYRIGILESSTGDVPDCLTQTATAFAPTVNAGGGNNLTFNMSLSCRESHTVPSGVDFQEMAVGSSGGVWYLFLRTSYNSSESGRILIAEAAEGGTEVKAWLLSFRDNDGDGVLDTPGAGDAGSDDAQVIRVLANSSSGSYFYNSATYNYNNNPFVEVLINSDGTNINISRLKVSSGGSSSDRQSALANSGCVLASDITGSGTCTGLTSLPTASGLSADLAEANLSNTTLTDIKSLLSLDISALPLFTATISE